ICRSWASAQLASKASAPKVVIPSAAERPAFSVRSPTLDAMSQIWDIVSGPHVPHPRHRHHEPQHEKHIHRPPAPRPLRPRLHGKNQLRERRLTPPPLTAGECSPCSAAYRKTTSITTVASPSS